MAGLGGGGDVGTGYVKIKPDTAGFGNELEKGVEGQGKKAGSKLGGAVGMAAKGAFAAGVAGMAKGVLDFGEFDAGMREVFTLMPDLAGEARDEMTQNVKNFSAEFGVIPDEVIPSLYNSISAGVPPDNVFEFLEQSQKLAKGGATDLATAVDGLSSVVNAYGPDVLSAADASDSLFTAVKLGKTTVDEMSGSLFQVAPIAAATGIGFDEVAASIATLTAQGTPTSVAATQMKGAIAELGKEGSKAWTAFEEASGQTFPAFIEGGGNLTDALALMQTSAEENDTSISNMFGSLEAGQAALGIVSDLDKSAANLAAVGDAAGATDVAFEEMNQGLAATMDRLKAKFSVALIDLGTALAPTIETIGIGIAGLMDAFTALPAPMRTGIVLFATLSAGIIAFAGPVMKLIKVFGLLGKAMTLLAANPWMIAVIGLVAVTILIIKNWDKVTAALSAAWDWITSAGEATGRFFQGLWESVTGAVVAAWDGMVSGITSALSAIGDAVTSALDAIGSAISWYLDLYVTVFTTAWDVITAVFSTAWNTITGVVSWAVELVRGVIDFGMSVITEVINRNLQVWSAVFSTVWNGIQTTIQTVWNGITAITDGAVSTLSTIIDRILEWPARIGSGLATLAEAIAAPFRAAFSGIQSAWNSGPGGFGFSVPGWVPGVGGKGFTIPSMATGGVAAFPMVAQIGDAGAGDPEIVSPVSLMRETVTDALGAARGGAGTVEVHTHLHADGMTDIGKLERLLEKHGTEVVRIVQRELDRERRAAGKNTTGAFAA